MGPARVEPEHRWCAGGAGPRDGELDPVADRDVLRLARAPHVAGADAVLEQHLSGSVDDLHGAGLLDLERLVVAAVLLGGLGHQADVGHRAHRGGVEGAVRAAVVDDGLVDAGVAAVGDDGERVAFLAVGSPHVAGRADHRRHRGVDDDVAGHVQVGDALVGIDHRERRAVGETLLDGGLDLGAVGQSVEPVEDRAESVARAEAGGGEVIAELLEHGGQERLDDVAEDDRVGDLHHRGLQVHGEQDALVLGSRDLRRDELVERGGPHHRAVDHFTCEHRERVLQDGDSAVVGNVLNRDRVVGLDDDGLLVRAEVVGAHRRDVRARVAAPLPHRVRVRAGVVLDRGWCPSIGVALAQHRVDRAALDLVVARADVLLLVGRRVLRVVGEGVALRLELGDRGLELRDRGADVRQLDDVGLGRLRQCAQLGQGVAGLLLGRQVVTEQRDDAAGQGDVAGLDVDAGGRRVRLDDRKEGVGGQERCFVGVRVDDRGHAGRPPKDEMSGREDGVALKISGATSIPRPGACRDDDGW